jgi:predicted AlkP superfamily pyrophosphatase or phosphodiesterase
MPLRTSARLATTLGALLLTSPAAAQTSTSQVGAQGAAQHPKLVVLITVDQMRPDYFTRWPSQLTGGLARLYHGGAVFTNAFQDHAITVTAQGHATTLSGRFPRSTGIISDDLGVPDSQNPLVGGGGPGASPFRFRGSTLLDWMRLADIRSRALSVSRKDRGAILPVGRAPQEVYWYAPGNGRFTTSRYYHDTLPSWIEQFNARHEPARFVGQSWTLMREAAAYREPDSVRIESQGKDFVFPHVLPSDTAAALRALPDYPWMDQITLDLALDGLQALQLGAGDATDLLCISLSSTDAVGHRFGPDSREMHDQILRLDRSLGTFLDSLYTLRDSNQVVIALTADHGGAPYPGVHSADPNQHGRFLDPHSLIAPEQHALAARGLPDSTIQFADGLILLQRAPLRRAHIDADSLIAAMERRLRVVRGIARVETRAELARRDTTTDYIARRWAHMVPPDLPDVALMVTADPYVVLTNGSYDTHGTPYDYDAHVPMILYGAPFRPGQYASFAPVVDLAPTLAAVLNVHPTERLDGHVLRQALR